MPRKCCVPGCNSNYDSVKEERVSVFTFPVDPEKRNQWQRKIPRKDFVLTKQSVVCAKHFTEDCILRVDTFPQTDGTVLIVKRKIPRLAEGAYPTIFPNCPSYLSEQTPVKRKAPEERRKEAQKRDEASFCEWMENDKINRFSNFTDNIQAKLDGAWFSKIYNDEHCALYKIEDSPSSKSSLVAAIKIFKDMHVEVFSLAASTLIKVPDSSLTWLFGKQFPPKLSAWSQFDSLVSHFDKLHEENENPYQKSVMVGQTASRDTVFHSQEDNTNKSSPCTSTSTMTTTLICPVIKEEDVGNSASDYEDASASTTTCPTTCALDAPADDLDIMKPSTAKKRKPDDDEIMNAVADSLKLVVNKCIDGSIGREEKRPEDYFAEYVASSLRAMAPRRKQWCMHEIQSLLFKANMEQFINPIPPATNGTDTD